jgi:hypothetical protein
MILPGETRPRQPRRKRIARGQKAGLKLGQPFGYGESQEWRVKSGEQRAESGEESVETGGIGRTALLLTNTNATGDYQKADLANGGGFATDHPNGLCDADEDQSS